MTTTAWLGRPVEDASEETFLLFSQEVPSSNLGYIDSASATIDIDLCNRSLTLRQSPGLLKSDRSTGTTGAVLWKITPLVIEWLASMPSCLSKAGILHSDAVVVELGCGIAGLIGIIMAPLVSTYILSDQAYVMKTLRCNVEENANASDAPARPRAGSSKKANKLRAPPRPPKLVVLDWETDDAPTTLKHELPEGRAIDLVIVCDCVYNEHLITPLVKTLADVCGLSDGMDTPEKPTFVLIAQQLRSSDVLEQFIASLMSFFAVWRVPDQLLPRTLQPGSGYAVHLACLKTHLPPPMQV